MVFDRTFHPDEANQAFTTGRLLETGQYAYQPQDHHGPTLYYAAAALQRAAGHADTASLDGTLLRCTPLVFASLALAYRVWLDRRGVPAADLPAAEAEAEPSAGEKADLSQANAKLNDLLGRK